MKRLQLGLTDIERRELDQNRRARNCLILLAVGGCIAGMIANYFN